ncbi:ABC transporter permease [Pusillimonas sp. T2]|uniref:ABC transporter permease n=1 Tax=Pusillimonas sp. T2 TaxID=1548123 RepID=UPI000B9465D3|nr:ABC transporter permease [Pusillimonas sp. T2]OXR49903.1 ABC transporter permease [Pusillimonas sp. T2]
MNTNTSHGAAQLAPEIDKQSWAEQEAARMVAAKQRYLVSLWFWRLVVIAALLGIWQVAADTGLVNKFFISSPQDIGRFLVDNLGDTKFWEDAWITVQETLWGFGIAGILGVVVAFVLVQSRMLREVLDPILSFLNSLPRVAFAPLFVAFFGLGMMSKIVLAFSLCFFIVLNGALTGLGSIDPDLRLLTRQLGASRLEYFTKLVIPNALPSIFAALRLSLIYGFLAVVVGEMIGSNRGLGQQIAYYSGVLRTDAVFALLFVLGLIATFAVELLRKIENYLLRWQ